jgi:thermostable 8-oxoguanine DNA glycosylase
VSIWQEAWERWGDTYSARATRSTPADEIEARRELLFCLLGGHSVSYELALSATHRLANLGILSGNELNGDKLERLLARELARPQFDPRRLDGSFRRYRYPHRKAFLLRQATDWINRAALDGLVVTLGSLESEAGRREFMCACPGVGPKTASWVLRNTGFATHLAVLDVHVIRALKASGRLGECSLPRDYDRAERHFLTWCEDLKALPAAFDLLLWELQRGSLVFD